MKKNFITVTPDSGTSGSSNTISVAAEPNILLKERSEILKWLSIQINFCNPHITVCSKLEIFLMDRLCTFK